MKEKILNIIENIGNKSNKDIQEVREILINEFDKTKETIIALTKHLDIIEEFNERINTELKKRNIL